MNEADILATTYYDLADVYRYVDEERDGETTTTYKPIRTKMPCALSKQKAGAHEQGMPQAKVLSDMLLFCRPDEDIQEGDKVSIHVGGFRKPDEYIAGKPFWYISHLEIPLKQELEP